MELHLPTLMHSPAGLFVFQILGGCAPGNWAPWGNGIALAIMVYATAHISGGHLNPAVSFALAFTKHISWMRCWVFSFFQILGAIFGSLVAQGLVPSDHLWQNYKSKSIRSAQSSGAGSGCFFPVRPADSDPAIEERMLPGDQPRPGCLSLLQNNGATHGQVFGWECVTTFMLVLVVYSVAVTKPGHGNMGPLVVGFTLFCSAIAAGPYSGASLNPARFLAPASVFGCSWEFFHLYIFGEYFGALLAALLFYVFFAKAERYNLEEMEKQNRTRFVELQKQEERKKVLAEVGPV